MNIFQLRSESLREARLEVETAKSQACLCYTDIILMQLWTRDGFAYSVRISLPSYFRQSYVFNDTQLMHYFRPALNYLVAREQEAKKPIALTKYKKLCNAFKAFKLELFR